jgi:F0F1-type ATP synthase beta subunit
MSEMCYATKSLNKLQEAIDEIRQNRKIMRDRATELDRQLSQKYHELETRKAFNAAEGWYIAVEIQKILQKRRVAKGEFARLDSVYKSMNINQIKHVTENCVKSVVKSKRRDDNYTVNFSEEAFEILQ